MGFADEVWAPEKEKKAKDGSFSSEVWEGQEPVPAGILARAWAFGSDAMKGTPYTGEESGLGEPTFDPLSKFFSLAPGGPEGKQAEEGIHTAGELGVEPAPLEGHEFAGEPMKLLALPVSVVAGTIEHGPEGTVAALKGEYEKRLTEAMGWKEGMLHGPGELDLPSVKPTEGHAFAADLLMEVPLWEAGLRGPSIARSVARGASRVARGGSFIDVAAEAGGAARRAALGAREAYVPAAELLEDPLRLVKTIDPRTGRNIKALRFTKRAPTYGPAKAVSEHAEGLLAQAKVTARQAKAGTAPVHEGGRAATKAAAEQLAAQQMRKRGVSEKLGRVLALQHEKELARTGAIAEVVEDLRVAQTSLVRGIDQPGPVQALHAERARQDVQIARLARIQEKTAEAAHAQRAGARSEAGRKMLRIPSEGPPTMEPVKGTQRAVGPMDYPTEIGGTGRASLGKAQEAMKRALGHPTADPRFERAAVEMAESIADDVARDAEPVFTLSEAGEITDVRTVGEAKPHLQPEPGEWMAIQDGDVPAAEIDAYVTQLREKYPGMSEGYLQHMLEEGGYAEPAVIEPEVIPAAKSAVTGAKTDEATEMLSEKLAKSSVFDEEFNEILREVDEGNVEAKDAIRFIRELAKERKGDPSLGVTDIFTVKEKIDLLKKAGADPTKRAIAFPGEVLAGKLEDVAVAEAINVTPAARLEELASEQVLKNHKLLAEHYGDEAVDSLRRTKIAEEFGATPEEVAAVQTDEDLIALQKVTEERIYEKDPIYDEIHPDLEEEALMPPGADAAALAEQALESDLGPVTTWRGGRIRAFMGEMLGLFHSVVDPSRRGTVSVLVAADHFASMRNYFNFYRSTVLRDMYKIAEGSDDVLRAAFRAALNRETISKQPEAVQEIANLWVRMADNMGTLAEQEGVLSGQLENYVHYMMERMSDGPEKARVMEVLRKGQQSEGGLWSMLGGKPSAAKHRKSASFAEYEERLAKIAYMADIPKEALVAEENLLHVADAYMSSMSRAINNKALVNTLKGLHAEDGFLILQEASEAHRINTVAGEVIYKKADFGRGEALIRDAFKTASWDEGTKTTQMVSREYWVHKQGYDGLDNLFRADPFMHAEGMRRVRRFFNFVKRVRMYNPLIHGWNIMRNNVALRGVRGLAAPISGRRLFRAYEAGEAGATARIGEALKSGLNFKHGELGIDALTKEIPALVRKEMGWAGRTWDAIKHPVRTSDEFLWGTIVKGSQMNLWEHLRGNYITRLRKNPDLLKAARSEELWTQATAAIRKEFGHVDEMKVLERYAGRLASHDANNFMGTLQEHTMSAISRVTGTHALFARNWTYSNLRIFRAALGRPLPLFEGTAAKLIGSTNRKALARGATYLFAFPAAWNYAVTGHMPWDNEPGKKMKIAYWKANDGTVLYVETLGFLKDIFNWHTDPEGTLKAKTHPVPKTVADIVRNEKWPYGKGSKIVPEYIDTTTIKGFAQGKALQLGHAVNQLFLPFPLESGGEHGAYSPQLRREAEHPSRLVGRALGLFTSKSSSIPHARIQQIELVDEIHRIRNSSTLAPQEKRKVLRALYKRVPELRRAELQQRRERRKPSPIKTFITGVRG